MFVDISEYEMTAYNCPCISAKGHARNTHAVKYVIADYSKVS